MACRPRRAAAARAAPLAHSRRPRERCPSRRARSRRQSGAMLASVASAAPPCREAAADGSFLHCADVLFGRAGRIGRAHRRVGELATLIGGHVGTPDVESCNDDDETCASRIACHRRPRSRATSAAARPPGELSASLAPLSNRRAATRCSQRPDRPKDRAESSLPDFRATIAADPSAALRSPLAQRASCVRVQRLRSHRLRVADEESRPSVPCRVHPPEAHLA